MTLPAPSHVATKDLFRLDGRTIIGNHRPFTSPSITNFHSVSGGAGAVGIAVGKTILESGGDVLFLDILAHPSNEAWSTFTPYHSPHVTYLTRNSIHNHHRRPAQHPRQIPPSLHPRRILHHPSPHNRPQTAPPPPPRPRLLRRHLRRKRRMHLPNGQIPLHNRYKSHRHFPHRARCSRPHARAKRPREYRANS